MKSYFKTEMEGFFAMDVFPDDVIEQVIHEIKIKVESSLAP